MQNHETENQQPEVVGESSDRRDFLKKMVVAGAFAAPVVATFARGIRGSKSLQAAVEENIASGALDAEAGAVLAQQGHFLNASARRPAVVFSNTTRRAKSSALPTTTTKPAKPTTTTRPTTKNGTLPPTRSTIAGYSNTTTPRATTTTKPK